MRARQLIDKSVNRLSIYCQLLFYTMQAPVNKDNRVTGTRARNKKYQITLLGDTPGVKATISQSQTRCIGYF